MPLWLCFKQQVSKSMGQRPFRFLASWLTHEDFSRLVQRSWNAREDWNTNISSFTYAVKTWNTTTFGNITYRKTRLLNRLHGISRNLSHGWNPYLIWLQQQLWSEYEKVLHQEEVMWYQKSRCKWLRFGDRNTRYFHGTTVSRRKRQRIEALQDSNGEWVYDPDTLKSMTVSFFQNLYIDDMGNNMSFPIRGCFPSLSENDVVGFSADLRMFEVKKALFAIGALKASGPDGFQAIFFQKQWPIVGESVFQPSYDIFQNPHKIREINETLICLIPKIEDPCNIRQFRPISLCNVSYKIVTKILVNRMKGLMEKIIAPAQCSFVPGRHSSNNIIIMQEIIHSMKKKKQKSGFMAIKIDLEKAYDRLNWDFVRDTLEDIGFPSNMINIIWHCISSSLMKVLWNGEQTSCFFPSRGVRQGDPLPIYLCALY